MKDFLALEEENNQAAIETEKENYESKRSKRGTLRDKNAKR